MSTDRRERARSIVRRLPLDRRVALLSGRDAWHTEGVPEAGIPPVTLTDGPHGVRRLRDDGGGLGISDAAPATCFPTGITLAATWDVALLEEVGAALGAEAAALDVGVLLGPGLNLQRHPAGGRTFEYLSEDPVVAGHLAAALVRGIQSAGVGACLKHFAANHQETARMVVDTIVDDRTLHELELTAFEIAVRDGRPWTVMTAYNRLDGTYASSDRWLLTDVLRDRWGFDGLVVSDWGAVDDRVTSIAAGMDLEMPSSGRAYDGEVVSSVRRGGLAEAAVDRCAERVVELALRVVEERGDRTTAEGVDHDAHHALARRAAAAGTVLLTNDGTLPLRAGASLAIIGAFAGSPRFQGAGSSQVVATRVDDARSALLDRWDGPVRHEDGYDPDTGAATDEQLGAAVEAARHADVAVVFVGLPSAAESEGFDRTTLALPEGHERLVRAVLDAGVRPVVVLTNGGPVELPWADEVAALVEGFLGGQAGGSGIVDVLVGDADPGGRLAQSFPMRVGDLPAHAWFGDRRQVQHREGLAVGYRFHDTAGVPARFSFGHGLSYTTFALDDLRVTGDGDDREVAVQVTNTGQRAGSTVVQCYVHDVEASVPRPDQELRAFTKVRLDAGASAEVELHLDRRAFAVWDVVAQDWLVESGAFEVRVGTSSVDLPLRTTIDVTSDDELGPSATPVSAAADDEQFATALGRPIPPPPTALPLHRSSSIDDLAVTRRGRALQRALLAVAGRKVASVAGDDEATRRMGEAVVREMPVRTLVQFSEGRLSLRWLDAALRAVGGGRGGPA